MLDLLAPSLTLIGLFVAARAFFLHRARQGRADEDDPELGVIEDRDAK